MPEFTGHTYAAFCMGCLSSTVWGLWKDDDGFVFLCENCRIIRGHWKGAGS